MKFLFLNLFDFFFYQQYLFVSFIIIRFISFSSTMDLIVNFFTNSHMDFDKDFMIRFKSYPKILFSVILKSIDYLIFNWIFDYFISD